MNTEKSEVQLPASEQPSESVSDDSIAAAISPSPEPIHLSNDIPQKVEHADDVVLTQCILCILLVLLCILLHWLKPEWQFAFLDTYRQGQDAPPISWLNQFLQSFQAWITP
ncbi:MAG: hypothetical protein LIO74_02905 [Ruminococcus sp.]|nr:hypothetical protein [Ruminococcus sp.]